jgi:hypothetical protein
LILGRRRRERVLGAYAARYNRDRPHRALALHPVGCQNSVRVQKIGICRRNAGFETPQVRAMPGSAQLTGLEPNPDSASAKDVGRNEAIRGRGCLFKSCPRYEPATDPAPPLRPTPKAAGPACHTQTA